MVETWTSLLGGDLGDRRDQLRHTLPIRRVVGPADITDVLSAKEHTVRADIVPGGTFPDYELTDHIKIRRRLSELQGIDPMILVLSRGGFCPKDHQQHLELAANYPKIARRLHPDRDHLH